MGECDFFASALNRVVSLFALWAGVHWEFGFLIRERDVESKSRRTVHRRWLRPMSLLLRSFKERKQRARCVEKQTKQSGHSIRLLRWTSSFHIRHIHLSFLERPPCQSQSFSHGCCLCAMSTRPDDLSKMSPVKIDLRSSIISVRIFAFQ